LAVQVPTTYIRSKRPVHAVGKEKCLLKSSYFFALGLTGVKTIADGQTYAAYHNKHHWRAFYWYQHWWPWM